MEIMTPDITTDVTTDAQLNLTFGEEIDNFVTDARRISEALVSADEPFCYVEYASVLNQNRLGKTIRIRYGKKEIPPELDPDFIPVCVIFTKSGAAVETETYMRHAIQILSDYVLTLMGLSLDFRFVGGELTAVLDAVNKTFTFRFCRVGTADMLKTIRLSFG